MSQVSPRVLSGMSAELGLGGLVAADMVVEDWRKAVTFISTIVIVVLHQLWTHRDIWGLRGSLSGKDEAQQKEINALRLEVAELRGAMRAMREERKP